MRDEPSRTRARRWLLLAYGLLWIGVAGHSVVAAQLSDTEFRLASSLLALALSAPLSLPVSGLLAPFFESVDALCDSRYACGFLAHQLLLLATGLFQWIVVIPWLSKRWRRSP